MRDPWRITAVAFGLALYVQVQRCRRAEARAARLIVVGAVDLEPLIAAAENIVDGLAEAGGLRPSRSVGDRSAVSLAAVPSAP